MGYKIVEEFVPASLSEFEGDEGMEAASFEQPESE
jgi:hypothetical protein